LKTQIRSAGSNIRCLSFFFEEIKSFAMSFALLRPLVFLIIQHPIYFFNSRRTLLKQCPKFHSIGGRRRWLYSLLLPGFLDLQIPRNAKEGNTTSQNTTEEVI
jgi:hypothetical protein